MAVRNDFTAGEVLAAADLNDTFASKLPYSYGTATPSTTDSGFLWYDSNSTPAAPKFWDGAAFQALTSGKILQVVRATDSTRRTTTSATYVDTNMSITITPTKSTSAILVIVSVWNESTSGDTSKLVITDSSNNALSGAEELGLYHATGLIEVMTTGFGYSTPATTSATTYKVRFLNSGGGTHTIYNDLNTGQMFALEIAA